MLVLLWKIVALIEHNFYFNNSINRFSQFLGGNNLLNLEKCSYFHSVKKDTVDDRCDLQLLFVFETTFFTRFHLIVRDRAGETAESHIDYNAAEMTRDNNVIIIPGLNGELYRIWLPQFILEILTILAAIAGTMYVAKKRNITLFKRVKNEKGYSIFLVFSILFYYLFNNLCNN
jgi:hypothetical protein